MLLDGLERLVQVGQNIVDVLNADGQPDGAGADALVQQLRLGELGVGGGGGVDDQALHIGHVGQQGEDFQMVDELVGLLLPAFYRLSRSK